MQITFLRVAGAIAQLDFDRSYPKASSEDAAYIHQLRAAHRHGVFEPFSDEAQELNRWLLSVLAGPELCRKSWDAFMKTRAIDSESLRKVR